MAHILLIEDNSDIHEILKDLFRRNHISLFRLFGDGGHLAV